MAVSNDQIIVLNDKRLNDKRLTKIIFFTVLAALGISFIALWYTASISSIVKDVGIIRELEKTQYNQQLYLDLVAHVDSIQQARMDTAARNRADYVRIQHRTDSIIAYETKMRALDKIIRDIHIKELKRKGLWKDSLTY